MNSHHCIFKILEKNQNQTAVTDGHMDGRENSIRHHKQSLQGGGWVCVWGGGVGRGGGRRAYKNVNCPFTEKPL